MNNWEEERIRMILAGVLMNGYIQGGLKEKVNHAVVDVAMEELNEAKDAQLAEAVEEAADMGMHHGYEVIIDARRQGYSKSLVSRLKKKHDKERQQLRDKYISEKKGDE